MKTLLAAWSNRITKAIKHFQYSDVRSFSEGYAQLLISLIDILQGFRGRGIVGSQGGEYICMYIQIVSPCPVLYARSL